MSINETATPLNSPQILPFPAENRSPQLSINTDDSNNRLFYIKYYTLVKTRCLAILGNREDAEDMTQNVFEKIQKLKSKGQHKITYPKTYLSATAKNMSINQKKRARRELIEVYDMAANGSLNLYRNKGEEAWEAGIIDNCYEQTEAKIIIKAILGGQDETTRKIYFYKYHDDMTLEQIGEIVGLKKSAVHKRIKDLEGQIRSALGKEGK
jgi:RNA polymerase sigma-70 factor (ECF subfamily)